MANNNPPSIKDNPFKRLDALRTKVSGVKAPAPAAAAPPVPPRRPSDGSAASHASTASPPVPPRPAAAPKLPPRRPSDASTASTDTPARPPLPQRTASTASHASSASRRHSLPGQPLPLPTTLRTPATSDDHEDRPLPPLPPGARPALPARAPTVTRHHSEANRPLPLPEELRSPTAVVTPTAVDTSPSTSVRDRAAAFEKKPADTPSVPSRPVPSRSVSSVSAAPPLPQRSVSALSDASVCCSEPQFATVTATFAPSEAWQLAVAQDSRVEVLKVEDDGWAEVRYEQGTRGMVPRSYLAIDAPAARPPPPRPAAPLRSVSTLSSVTDDASGQQPRMTATGTWSSLSSVGGHRASVIERTASSDAPTRPPLPQRTASAASDAPPLPQRTASTTSADEPPRVPPRRMSSTSSVASRVSAFEAIGLHAPEPAAAAPPSMDGTRCTAVATFNAVEALGQLSLKPGSVVIRHTTDGDWCEVTECTTGKRGKVPASAIQEVRETSAAAPPPTSAPEKKKGYTYSSLPSLTGGPKRKIYKQPKKR